MSDTRDGWPGRGPIGWLIAAVALLTTGIAVALWPPVGFRPWGWALIVTSSILQLVVAIREGVRTSPRRRRRAFAMRYSSLDDVRATLDLDELRALRAAEGELAAVREIRRRAPLVGLEQATEIARGL